MAKINMHTKNMLTTNRKPMQVCVMKIKNKKIKKKRLPTIFCNQKREV